MSPNIENSNSNSMHGDGVPFSWENQPGTPLPNETLVTIPTRDAENAPRLPPPPSLTPSRKPAMHGIYVPLPPCPFQPPQKITPVKGGSAEDDDPFLKAYLECTKSGGRPRPEPEIKPKKRLWSKVKRAGLRLGHGLACNSNHHVRESSMGLAPQHFDSD